MQPKNEFLNAEVLDILPLESGSNDTTGKSWARQSFVIKTDAEYPKEVKIDFMSAKAIEAFNRADLSIGSRVNVGVSIESKQFNSKWYTSVIAYFIKKVAETPDGSSYEGENDAPEGSAIQDDLPF